MMAKPDDLRRAAMRARTALSVLRCAFPDPSSAVERALGIIAFLIDEADAGRNPLALQDDWPARVLWPSRPHWDCWSWAIKTLAVAGGARVHCSQKYAYMRVDIGRARNSNLTMALTALGDLIERSSDMED